MSASPTETTVSSSPKYSTLTGSFRSLILSVGVGSFGDNNRFNQLTKARAAAAPRENPYTYNFRPSSFG
ncbi:hypothetical protein PSRE111525_18645 [Pseudomonas reidholzensis]